LNAMQMKGGKTEYRKIPVPPNRFVGLVGCL
jgi:hypothetical protein